MYPTVIHNWHLFSEQNYSTYLTKNNFKYSWPFLKLNVTWSLQYLIQCFRTKAEWVTNVISRSITQYSLTTNGLWSNPRHTEVQNTPKQK